MEVRPLAVSARLAVYLLLLLYWDFFLSCSVPYCKFLRFSSLLCLYFRGGTSFISYRVPIHRLHITSSSTCSERS